MGESLCARPRPPAGDATSLICENDWACGRDFSGSLVEDGAELILKTDDRAAGACACGEAGGDPGGI